MVAVAFVTMAIGVNARTSFSLLFAPILDEFVDVADPDLVEHGKDVLAQAGGIAAHRKCPLSLLRRKWDGRYTSAVNKWSTNA